MKKRVFNCDLADVTDEDIRDKLEEILDKDIPIADSNSDFITKICFRGPFRLSFGQRRLALILINKYLGGKNYDVACKSNKKT